MSDQESLLSSYIEVNLSVVPLFLRKGAFYQSFGYEPEGGMVAVPANTIKPDLTLTTTHDLAHLLTSLRFWGVDGVVSEVVDYVLQNTDLEGKREVLIEFELNFPYLRPLHLYLSNPKADLLRLVVQSGCVELVKYLHEGGRVLQANLPIFAAQKAHKPCLEYLFSHGCSCYDGTFKASSTNGNLDCFKLVLQAYLLHNPEKEVRWTVPIIDTNIDCFIHAYHNTPPSRFKGHILQAMMYKGIESIKYGHERGLPLQSNQLIQAIKTNDFEAFQLLHQLGCPWNIGVTTEAADNLKLNFLQYAMQRGCRWNGGNGFALNAVRNNRLDCLKFSCEHGSYWSVSTTYLAAQTGHFECLQYLHEQGCRLDSSVLQAAVEKHHLHCVEYLLREGCPWDRDVVRAAKRANNPCRELVLRVCGDIEPAPSKW